MTRKIVEQLRGAGPLVSRMVTVTAALVSLLAILTSSKLLAVVAVALAGSLLVRATIGLLRALLRPLAPALAPLRRAVAFFMRRFDAVTGPIRRWVKRDRDCLGSWGERCASGSAWRSSPSAST